MSESNQDQSNKVTSRPFSEMGFVEKIRFIGKVVVFLISGGFLFPNIFSE